MTHSSRRDFLKTCGRNAALLTAGSLLSRAPLAQAQTVTPANTPQPAAIQPASIPSVSSQPLVAQPVGDRPLIGAIRWDAWIGERGPVGKAVEASLGPMRWHGRLPFYAQVLGEDKVRIDGVSPVIMDQEIAYARRAGLDYWAFVTYPANDPMMQPLQLYLASEHRREINFSLILECPRWGRRESYQPEQLARYIDLMGRESYQKVLGNRPLFFVLGGDQDQIVERWGGFPQLKAVIDEFRRLAQHAGLGNPYIVLMGGGNTAADKAMIAGVGYDALSSYAMSDNAIRGTYAELAHSAESYWDRCRDAGAEVVPNVMTSWDRRPRIQHPVPWETSWQKPMENFDHYYELPSPTELAVHLQHAVTWVNANPQAAKSRAVIVYAWNEHDEGGWLAPTLGEGAARIDAFTRVLRKTE